MLEFERAIYGSPEKNFLETAPPPPPLLSKGVDD